MPEPKYQSMTSFGFSLERGGAHSSRTMMLEELSNLFAYINRVDASKADYQQAIDQENCLKKRSGKTRILTFRHLVDLYGLDPNVPIFKVLLFFWERDPAGQSLLALLCVYCRDSIFRATAPFILDFPEGAIITRVALEKFIDELQPGRFSKATLKSTAQNINSTWTKSGHEVGRSKKIRSRAIPTVGSVAYALYLGYLNGSRGPALFKSEYIRLLDCSADKAMALAEEASRKGWIVFKRVGEVMEVLFPNLILPTELEWLRE
jgi:hypothetical protein